MKKIHSLYLGAFLAQFIIPAVAYSYSIRADLEFIPAADVQRWEVRASNSDGSLLLGNLQVTDLLQGDSQSKPVYWIYTPGGWQQFDLPFASEFAGGFNTISALGGGQEVLVGRAFRNGRVEGFAYQYVSQRLHWTGALPGVDENAYNVSRITGVDNAGNLFVGSALNENGWFVPITSTWDEPMEVVSMPSGAMGGWLYAVSSSGESGAGYLDLADAEGNYTYTVAARWTADEGMVMLDSTYSGPGRYADAINISGDGRFMLGQSAIAEGVRAPTVWDREADYDPVVLPFPEDGNFTAGSVNGSNSDGTRFFGAIRRSVGEDNFEWHAVVWHGTDSVEYLADFVAREYRLNLTSGRFRSATQNPNSLNITGSIEYSDGRIAPFAIRLRSITDGFQMLGYPSGSRPSAEARAISNDGSVIVGIGAGMNGAVPHFWTSATGWQSYPFAPGAIFTPFFLPANAVTPDGSTSVGRTPGPNGTPTAFISHQGNITDLGYASDSPTALSQATGVSQDGTKVVGQATFDMGDDAIGNHAFIWQQGTGFEILDPGSTALASWGYGLSGDGNIAVGWITEETGLSTPVTWNTQTRSHTALPMADGFVSGQAVATNLDGSIVIGTLTNLQFQTQAVIWENGGAPYLIPILPGFVQNGGWFVTDDGQWFGGQSLSASADAAEGFIYHREEGLYNLHDFMLRKYGRLVDREFTPRTLRFSPNGSWIIGDVSDPIIQGSRVPFRIKVPENRLLDYFGEVDAVVSNGFNRTWFGLLQDTAFPLVHHQYHGWLVLSAWGENGGYAFDTKIGWMHIRRDNYPYLQIYGFDNQPRWYYYQEGSTNPRRFYDLANSNWVNENDL